MKALGTLAVLVVILLVGGAISSGLVPSLPLITQSVDPNASVAHATPEQANQLFFWIIFVVVNVLGAGITIAVLIWFGSRAVVNARAMPNASKDEQLPETTA